MKSNNILRSYYNKDLAKNFLIYYSYLLFIKKVKDEQLFSQVSRLLN